jgi:single-stranded DNA-binding protein
MRMVVSCYRKLTDYRPNTLDPVRESDYHTIFNFRDRAAESLPQLIPGSQILVEGKWYLAEHH